VAGWSLGGPAATTISMTRIAVDGVIFFLLLCISLLQISHGSASSNSSLVSLTSNHHRLPALCYRHYHRSLLLSRSSDDPPLPFDDDDWWYTFSSYDMMAIPSVRRNLVTTETSLNANIISNSVVDIDGDIDLSIGSITISNVVSLTIEGNGFKVDGRGLVGCFFIQSSSSIRVNNLTVSGGGNEVGGGIFQIN
jgi:hypothetical protein